MAPITAQLISFASLAVIALAALAMYRRVLPAMLALPLAALAIALIATLPTGGLASLDQAMVTVFGEGPAMLAKVVVAVVLGGALARALELSGTTRDLVRFATEFSGTSELSASLIVVFITALLFTVIGGIGAVIMVASFTLPLLRALRLPPLGAGALFLFALSLGGTLNPVNWQLYISVLGLSQAAIVSFAALGALLMALATFLLSVRLNLHRTSRRELLLVGGGAAALAASALILYLLGLSRPLALLLSLAGYGLIFAALFVALARLLLPAGIPPLMAGLAGLILPLAWLFSPRLFSFAAGREVFSPPIPLALAAGLAVAVTALPAGRRINAASRSLIEGVASTAPALVIILGIGTLISAVRDLEPVRHAVELSLSSLLPAGDAGLLLLGLVIAPLALFRGPMNLWGMGAGVLGLMLATGSYSPFALMALFFASGLIQGVSDPTNTHNVYLADVLGVEVFSLTRATLPWVYPVSALLLMAALLLLPGKVA